MGKFLTPNDYEEVEAFTQEEVEAKLTEAKASWVKDNDSSETVKAIETERDDWKSKHEKLSTRHEQLNGQYKEAKTELATRGATVDDTQKSFKEAHEKMITSRIAKAAGEDKEYAEKLREQFNRLNGETISFEDDVVETTMKEAHALTLTSLSRDFTPFTAGTNTGTPPVAKATDKTEQDKKVDALVAYSENVAGITSE